MFFSLNELLDNRWCINNNDVQTVNTPVKPQFVNPLGCSDAECM